MKNGASRLPLPLLMLWLKFVDNIDPSFATNDFVVRTDLFDTSTYFHVRIISFLKVTHCFNLILSGAKSANYCSQNDTLDNFP